MSESLLVHSEWLKDTQDDKQSLGCSGREMHLEHKESSFTRKSYLNTQSESRYLRFPGVRPSPALGGVPEY